MTTVAFDGNRLCADTKLVTASGQILSRSKLVQGFGEHDRGDHIGLGILPENFLGNQGVSVAEPFLDLLRAKPQRLHVTHAESGFLQHHPKGESQKAFASARRG